MNDCCAKTKSAKTCLCPSDGTTAKAVSTATIKHQLDKPWQWQLDGDYYYCDNPCCDIVYFNNQDLVINREHIRTNLLDKQMLCYCYGVTQADYENDEHIKAFIIQETKSKNCACEARNPSGRCCLSDFK